MRWVPPITAAAAAAAIVFTPARGEACKCRLSEAGRELLPVSGTRDFPTNGRIRVFLHAFPDSLRARMGEEYRLRDAAGALVALDTATHGTMLSLAPRTALRPKSRYTIERVFAYEAGSRLSDQERGYLAFLGKRRPDAPAASGVARFWFPEAWFETGVGPERKRSETPTLNRSSVDLHESNCGPGPNLYVRYQTTGLAATDVVGLERKDVGIIGYFLPSPDVVAPTHMAAHLGNNRCDPDSMALPKAPPWELRLVTLSISDQKVAATSWASPNIEGTASERTIARVASPSGAFWSLSRDEPGGVKRWFAPPAQEPTTRDEPRGPAVCPWGLEVDKRVVLDTEATRGGPRAWQPLAIASTSGTISVVGAVWDETDAGHLLKRTRAGTLSAVALPRPGRLAAAAFVGDGFVLTAADRTPSPPTFERVRPSRVRLDGKLLWRQSFGGPGYNSSSFLAWQSQRTLVCWQQSAPGAATENRLMCVVLSSRDGRVLRDPFQLRTEPRDTPEHSSAIGNAALAVEGGFLVAWKPARPFAPHEPGVSLTRLDQDGTTLETTVLGSADPHFIALTKTATGAVVAWDQGPDGVELGWLGSDGRPRPGADGGPVRVSSGTGHAPHWPTLAARQDLVAVSWQVREGATAFVAVSDASGAVSPALQIGDGPADHPVMAATQDGFLLAYGVGRRVPPRLETLRCRTRPPPLAVVGAPQRLAPNR